MNAVGKCATHGEIESLRIAIGVSVIVIIALLGIIWFTVGDLHDRAKAEARRKNA